MHKYKSWLAVMVLAIAMLGVGLETGCSSTKLDPSGVYAGDQFLYQSENIINTAHESFIELYRWEKDFRTVLPAEVSRAVDYCRLNEERWIGSANALHDAYVRTPSAENKDKFQLSLNILQTALREAASYMLAAKQQAPNNGLKNVKPLTAGGAGGVLPVKK